MQIIIQFITLWASLYFLSMGFHYFLVFLSKKNAYIRLITPILFSLSIATHELAHHLVAKLTGANVKLENIDFKKGSYTYIEKDKTLLKSLLVSLAPSILGSLAIFEIVRFIKMGQEYPFWVFVILNIVMIVIFLGLPSSSADFYLILKTFSENPLNLLSTFLKSLISAGVIIRYYGDLCRLVPIRSPYWELFAFGVFYFLLRIMFVVIPLKIAKRVKKENKNRLVTRGPGVYVSRKIRNPNYYVDVEKIERNADKEFLEPSDLPISSKSGIEFEKLPQEIQLAMMIEDSNISFYLLMGDQQGFCEFHKSYEKISKRDSIINDISKIQSYLRNREQELKSGSYTKQELESSSRENREFKSGSHEKINMNKNIGENQVYLLGLYLAALKKIVELDSSLIEIPSSVLSEIYSASVDTLNFDALVLELKQLVPELT